MKKVIIVAVITVVIVLAAWFGFVQYKDNLAPCSNNKVSNALEQMEDIISRFTTADKIAGSTPKIALGGQVSTLGAIMDEAEALEVPACLLPYKENIVKSMDSNIEGYLAFMSDKPNSDISMLFSWSQNYVRRADEELKIVNECVPFCK